MGKSQVSLFIVLAVIILLSVVLALYVLRDREDATKSESINGQPIAQLTEQCMKETANDAIEIVGFYGGDYYPRSDSMSDIALHLDGSDVLSPGKEDVERNIGRAIDESLLACINAYGSFWKEGLSVYPSEPHTVVFISDTELTIKTTMKTTIQQRSSEKIIESYTTKLDYPFGKHYSTVTEIISHHSGLTLFDYSYIDALSKQEGFSYEIIPFEGNHILSLQFEKGIRPLIINAKVKLNEEI